MHEWIDSEISAILLALIAIVVLSLVCSHQITIKSNPRLNKIKNLGSDIEYLAKKEEILSDYKSMLVTDTTCVICHNPTTRRCSRCKSTRYCSYECQVIHWKEGHKSKCYAPKANVYDHANKKESMCNKNHLQPSKIVNPTIQLNPIRLGVYKSDNKKNNGIDKKPLPNPTKRGPCNLLPKCESLSKPKTLLFPYNYFIKLFEWNGLSIPCGLINCGNSCFANVVLQCLTYTRPLTAYLLNGCHIEDCKRNDWCFMCELQSHVCKVRHNQNPFSPIQILSRLCNIGNHLGYGRQEDAHEFMRFAIDSMQSICLDEFGGEKIVDHATQATTLIHHIFGGHLQSQVKCMECEHESNRYETMMDLAVEIHGIVESLEDALAQFTTIEMLDGDNKYKCDCCDAYVKAQKQLTIYEAPNILTIAFKRFQSGKFGKLNKKVTFPEVLDISPYTSGKTKEPLFYRLYAVVVHVDMLNASFFGHYICYVKDSDGVWYKIDDNKVKEVELEKVLAQRAYMLFYSRLKARVAPTIEGKHLQMFPTSLPTSTIDCTSICMESNGNSIFPPTLKTTSIPSEDNIVEKIGIKNDDTSNEDFALEDLSCGLSSNTHIEQVELHPNVARNDCDLNTKRTQSSHEYFPCTLTKTKQNNLNETCPSNDNNCERNTCQHHGNAFERLKSVSTSLNGKFDNMDIDLKNTSNVHDILVSRQTLNEPLDDRTSFPLDLPHFYKIDTSRINPCSSNVLLESLHSKRDIEVESSHLESLQRVDKNKFESVENIEILKDSIIIQKPCNDQGHMLMEKPQNLLSNVENESLSNITPKSSIEIHEESYNLKQNLEDDIPYVLVEPLRICKDMDSQTNVTQQSMEMFTIDLHDTIMKSTNDVTLNGDFLKNNIETKEQIRMNASILHTKFKKQVSKPVFFPGFLIKSPKSTLKESSTIVTNNVIKCEENIEGDCNGGNEGLSYDESTNISILNGKKSEYKNLDVNYNLYNHIISNGNHGDERNEFNEKSEDLPIDYGREDCASIFMDNSKNMSYIKQGRDDCCCCGSQQKWKKCCGKAITLKDGFTTKQVKV